MRRVVRALGGGAFCNALLLGLAEVDVAVEGAKLEVGAATVHRPVNGPVHLDAVLGAVVGIAVLVLVPVSSVVATVVLRRRARRSLRGLHVEIGVDIPTIAAHLQGGFRSAGKGDV